jgi:hypothetical protein
MSQKKIKPPSDEALARAKEMTKCEGELLLIFKNYKVTMPEAIFMFEKIKFSALHNDALRQRGGEQRPVTEKKSDTMFR